MKSLVRLLDKANELSRDMDKMAQYGQQDLDEYASEQRLLGAVVTDQDCQVVLQSGRAAEMSSLWETMLAKDYVREIMDHPEETYTERITADHTEYDLAVVPRRDTKGLVLAYSERNKNAFGEITLSSVFSDTPISMNGVIAVSLEDKIVSINQGGLSGKTIAELREHCSRSSQREENGIVCVRFNNRVWYGHEDQMRGYNLYLFFPESQVFMTRTIVSGLYTALASLIYLLWLLVQSNVEKTALRQSEKRLRMINALGTAYSSIVLFDLISGKGEIIKKADEDKADFVGKVFPIDQYEKSIHEWISAENCESFLQFMDMKTVGERLKGQAFLTSTVQLKNGKWLLSVIVPQWADKNGTIRAVLMANRDITEEKERERRQEMSLRNALSMAEDASKAKTNFLNSISHDIRTPMNAIIGFTALAIDHAENRELVLDYLNKINISSQHLLSLINDVLEMSRIESGTVKLEYATVHLPDLLHDLQEIVEGNIGAKQLDLQIDMEQLIHETIVTDKLRLNQVLLNVVSNAVKFTPVGGMIQVQVCEHPSDREGYAVYAFSVKDNGIGMTKEFQKHIFDAFSREETVTKNGIQGTGLGMSISKNLIEMMGGTISVNSEPGKGAEFVITLECQCAKTGEHSVCRTAAAKGSKASVQDKYRYAGKRILLAEDNELNREIAITILEEAGLKVDAVDDGIDAVVRMESVEDSGYDLILMDIQMPKMDGYTATREIRTLANSRKANIPIVAMTANAFEEDKQRALEAGMNAHIAKPICLEAILDTFDQIFTFQ